MTSNLGVAEPAPKVVQVNAKEAAKQDRLVTYTFQNFASAGARADRWIAAKVEAKVPASIGVSTRPAISVDFLGAVLGMFKLPPNVSRTFDTAVVENNAEFKKFREKLATQGLQITEIDTHGELRGAPGGVYSTPYIDLMVERAP